MPKPISTSVLLSSNEVGCKHTKQTEIKDEISWDGVIGRRRVGPHGWNERDLERWRREGRQTSGLGLIVHSGLSLLKNQFQFAPWGAVMMEGRVSPHSQASGSSPPIRNPFQGAFVDFG